MTSSDIVRRARAVFLAVAVTGCLGVVGVTLSANAGAPPLGAAKPMVGGAVRQSQDGNQGGGTVPQCFVSSQPCASHNPTVSFTMFSNGDTTGCIFRQDTSWGDGTADTILTYVGGANQAPIATFTHAYGAPGTFPINFTIVVTDNPNGVCTGGPGQLEFTLPAPPKLRCRSSQLTVPAVTAQVPLAQEPLRITYGPTPLAFTPGPATGGARCAMLPAEGASPISLKIPGAAPIPIGHTETTATIHLVAASSIASTIPNCVFGPLQALDSAEVTPPIEDFELANNCLLTPTYHASWDVVAKWTVPRGVIQMARSRVTNSDIAIYSTQPLTYYVDLATMPLPPGFKGSVMSALVDFIYSTLAENLPVLDRIALVQNPSAHLLVTTPFGREIGLDSKNRTHTFAGVGYAEVRGRSIAWVLEPLPGRYRVLVRGKARSKFSVDVADLQFLGHGTDPLVENFTWTGNLGGTGTAERRFSAHGTALSPGLMPHESKTRIKPLTQVRFSLTGSVIPFGIAKVLWRFGDGTEARGKLGAHRYHKVGRYTPTVTVTDALGYTVTVKLAVIVVQR